mmetsp:Transcript_38657/g.84313  ORF Transcript_38657/g.84313 Transcript_38657/m.84313 type:complete len:200 (-) Transcript_38657:302-901(-)
MACPTFGCPPVGKGRNCTRTGRARTPYHERGGRSQEAPGPSRLLRPAVLRNFMYPQGWHLDDAPLLQVVRIHDEGREVLAVAAAGVQAGAEGTLLQPPSGIVPEDDVLGTLPDACPRHAALRLGLEPRPPPVRLGLQVAEPEEVAEGLAREREARHHAGMHHDQRQPRERQRQWQLPEPADVLLRDLIEGVVAVALEAL